MAISVLFNILQWWTILFSIGLIFLPLTSLIFNSFFDRGYIFSKILGLLLVSFSIWFLASLKIFTFTSAFLLLTLGVFLLVNTYISYKKGSFTLIRGILKYAALEELLFITGLIFWAYIRSFEPSIHGLE